MIHIKPVATSTLWLVLIQNTAQLVNIGEMLCSSKLYLFSHINLIQNQRVCQRYGLFQDEVVDMIAALQ